MAENDILNSEEFDDSGELGTIILTLDDDTELECEIITIFPVGDKQYIVLLPINDADADEGVLIYRFIDNGEGDPEIENIEDDDEYDAVADAFDEMLDSEDFDDFEDEED